MHITGILAFYWYL